MSNKKSIFEYYEVIKYSQVLNKSLYANKFCKAGVLENFQIHVS